MLHATDTSLAIVDVQGKLARLMHEREELFHNLQRLVRGSRALRLPILWSEQNPEGLGPSIPEIADLLPDLEPMPKRSFSCCGDSAFLEALAATGRGQVIVCGIEAHVCVLQTAEDLLERDFDVHVPADAVSSRTAANREIGLGRMRDLGAAITCVETALFELVRLAEGDVFKEILKIVK